MEQNLTSAEWRLQSSYVEPRQGAQLATCGAGTAGWHAVSLPSTVLNALVKDGTYPDPRVALDTYKIPDAADEFNREHHLDRFSHLPQQRNPWADPWWYRTEFSLAAGAEGEHVWLHLDCLNYRAEVWLNGRLVAGREALVGMYQRFSLDVTDFVRAGDNALAILVWGPDHPGVPDTQLQVYGPVRGFLKDSLRDFTEVMTIGYDCFATVPDRNQGLLQDVRLEVTGPVRIRHPFVTCDLPLPELNPARLTVTAELTNDGGAGTQGTLRGVVVEDSTGRPVAEFAEPVSLPAGETRLLSLDPARYPQLALCEPQLWWPRGYGEQPLYRLELRFECGGGVSHSVSERFGLRRLDRHLHQRDGAHGFQLLVNGERIFCRGGYVQPELLLDWDAARIETELRYLAHANQNFIVFEDLANPPDVLLELCDRFGLMFWQCFYGCYWMQPSVDDELEPGVIAQRHAVAYPDDLELLETCTVDLLKRYRNHPSLVLYMAQNEAQTRQPVYEMWRRRVLELDPTRFLVPSGYFPDYLADHTPSWIRPELPVGMNDLLPKSYGWEEPATYYRWVRDDRTWMFKIETGSASVPPLASLRRFIPAVDDLPTNLTRRPDWPLDEVWAHHGANSYYAPFDQALRAIYGQPTTIEDYCWQAHLMSADAHRGIREAVNHRMWDLTSGFGDWKLNSAFPDVQWQLYDWYLRPTVSFYFVRKAGAPLVVQLSPLDQMVTVVNNTLDAVPGLTVRARVFNLDLKPIAAHEAVVEAPRNAYHNAFVLPRPAERDLSTIHFVRLELLDASGALVADNFYWLPWHRAYNSTTRLPQMRELRRLPAATVDVAVVAPLAPVTDGSAELEGTYRLSNPTADRLAFFIHLTLTAGEHGEELLPVFWSDNYGSLLPGEERLVSVRLPAAAVGSATVWVRVDGSNVTPVTTTA